MTCGDSSPEAVVTFNTHREQEERRQRVNPGSPSLHSQGEPECRAKGVG